MFQKKRYNNPLGGRSRKARNHSHRQIIHTLGLQIASREWKGIKDEFPIIRQLERGFGRKL